ncbi:crosslink repair DNA glycosylase YcaQ family protein [Dokdonella sp.]|uniref:winged helix-turn-helix domain-containing protein n=1 Tax=Dokdonella sp. TaxID=2291710 RepID=UPI0025B7D9A1|nr:crosslink repair DNA glycosylase YcaQ family protein [Dokdonella sp.]MBX3688334.1 YcaQ family DNA glycosylase [Dokdonella sp.]
MTGRRAAGATGLQRPLSLQQARNLHLAAQALAAPPRRRARKADVAAAIARMRVLQIDTIHVVARSPYLVLFSRLGNYRSQWLDETLAEGAIFECWAHEACFAPITDLALHRTEVGEGVRPGHWAIRSAQRTHARQPQALTELLVHIRTHGAVKSSDFRREHGSGGGWWGWKDEKRWLEALFARGELMIARRENFQRVYDLRERVLANASRSHAVADDLMDPHARERAFVLGAVRALGISQARWINDYFRSGRRLRDAHLVEFVESGDLLRVEVAGWDAPAYVHADHAALLVAARAGRLRATHTTLLSPFDPVVWDRQRAASLFDFDYRIECYTPASKRRHGYYVLPILHRGRLVGRIDAKAHRGEGRFEIKSLSLQEGVVADAALADALARAISDCAAWHATPRVTLGQRAPSAFAALLRAALRAADTR